MNDKEHGDDNGAKEIRTLDLCSAIAALYQLSYCPSNFRGMIVLDDILFLGYLFYPASSLIFSSSQLNGNI